MILHVDGGENQWTGNHRRLVAEIVPRQHCSLHVDGIGGLFLTSLLFSHTDHGDGRWRNQRVSHPEDGAVDHGAHSSGGSGHADVTNEHDGVADDAHPGNRHVHRRHETRVDEDVFDRQPDALQDHQRAREKRETGVTSRLPTAR